MSFNNEMFGRVYELFLEISKIPRPSYKEEKIAEYICSFAQKNGRDFYRDEYNNVLVNIPASVGYEGEAPILLQGHTDMVCEKNKGVDHDFSRQGVAVYEKDGYLRAMGTTLGADDGVAIALMLFIIEGGLERHPPLQCLFTSMEEVGLLGAQGFDYSRIYARQMINMDSGTEDKIIVGCAGGVESRVFFEKDGDMLSGNALRLRISGLCGGHSGEDIDKGRANANVLMGKLLSLITTTTGVRIVSVVGGSKTNAITRETEAVVFVEDMQKALLMCDKFRADTVSALGSEDSGFCLDADSIFTEANALSYGLSLNIIKFINTLPSGVLRYSKGLSGLVELSRNIGVIATDEKGVFILLSSRSAIEAELDMAEKQIDKQALLVGATVEHMGRYRGWEYLGDSRLLEKYRDTYRELFGLELGAHIIHAGLECGIIKSALDGLDCISVGPDTFNLHSPDETLDLASYERFSVAVCSLIQKKCSL